MQQLHEPRHLPGVSPSWFGFVRAGLKFIWVSFRVALGPSGLTLRARAWYLLRAIPGTLLAILMSLFASAMSFVARALSRLAGAGTA